MTILCADNCHVFLGSSSLCTCEAHRGPSGPTLAMLFPGYNPYAPPKATPPTDVDVARLRSAERAGAGWLSADGLRCYRDDRGNPEVAWWDDETGAFGSWWSLEDGIPADVVRM